MNPFFLFSSGRGMLWPAHFVCLLLVGILLVGCDRSREIVLFQGNRQGTTYHIKVVMEAGSPEKERVEKRVNEIFDRIDLDLSTYREDSEISRFNSMKSTEWISLSPTVVALSALAGEVSRKTSGCFDLTIKPLFDLWGFSSFGAQKVPDDAEIQKVLKHIGMNGIEVDLEGSRLRKKDPELQLDLSSIGQGYTVGEIAKLLESMGFSDYLVEIGGELKVRGQKPDGVNWRVAVEKPTPFSEQVQKLIDIRETQGTAIMTAGTYRHFFEQGGQVYSHILDPRIGRPVSHHLLSVTVLHEDPTLADLWDTALLCVGEAEALRIAEEEGLKVLLIADHDHQLVERMSKAFAQEDARSIDVLNPGLP